VTLTVGCGSTGGGLGASGNKEKRRSEEHSCEKGGAEKKEMRRSGAWLE
jgi:hypothetical protein